MEAKRRPECPSEPQCPGWVAWGWHLSYGPGRGRAETTSLYTRALAHSGARTARALAWRARERAHRHAPRSSPQVQGRAASGLDGEARAAGRACFDLPPAARGRPSVSRLQGRNVFAGRSASRPMAGSGTRETRSRRRPGGPGRGAQTPARRELWPRLPSGACAGF